MKQQCLDCFEELKNNLKEFVSENQLELPITFVRDLTGGQNLNDKQIVNEVDNIMARIVPSVAGG